MKVLLKLDEDQEKYAYEKMRDHWWSYTNFSDLDSLRKYGFDIEYFSVEKTDTGTYLVYKGDERLFYRLGGAAFFALVYHKDVPGSIKSVTEHYRNIPIILQDNEYEWYELLEKRERPRFSYDFSRKLLFWEYRYFFKDNVPKTIKEALDLLKNEDETTKEGFIQSLYNLWVTEDHPEIIEEIGDLYPERLDPVILEWINYYFYTPRDDEDE